MPRFQTTSSGSPNCIVSPIKSKTRQGLRHSPQSALFKTATKRGPSAPERSLESASKRPSANAAAPSSAAFAPLTPADGGDAKQFWLMKTDPDYMVRNMGRGCGVFLRTMSRLSFAP
jgi:hypothetical protein